MRALVAVPLVKEGRLAGVCTMQRRDVRFQVFSQVAPALERAQGGLGIGLALARGLVELHGGTVEGHSEGPGKGSKFVARMPVVARHGAISSRCTAEAAGTPQPQDGDKRRALQAGFDHHLTKPVSLEDLQSMPHASRPDTAPAL